jgi:hypothetical protein
MWGWVRKREYGKCGKRKRTTTMPRICYEKKAFRERSLALITKCNEIIQDYEAQGYTLTLRQLYYQLVSQNIIPNKPKEYDNLGCLVNDARYAGMIDWNALEDRTRNLRKLAAWDTPSDVIHSAARSYHNNLWSGQKHYVEVWIEKDSLVGVIEGVCDEWDVPHFSCRGYTSATEMWNAATRIVAKMGQEGHKYATILHLGDHDPSGIDMSRDIRDRINIFTRGMVSVGRITVERIALTDAQVTELGLPPNPAKVTDSRAAAYIEEYGEESWELDALTPAYMVNLIQDHVWQLLDRDKFEERKAKQEEERKLLTVAADEWVDVAEWVKDQYDIETGNSKEDE